MRSPISLTLIFLVCTVLTQSVFAQIKPIPLTVEDALSQKPFPSFMPISLSPDGQWIAYTLHNSRTNETFLGAKYRYFTPSGVYNGSKNCAVWLTNTRTGEAISLGPADGTSSWSPVWSPDGQDLAFYSDSGGIAHLWIWEQASRKARQVSDAIVRPNLTLQVPRWTPDSKKVLTRILLYGSTLEEGENGIATFLNQSVTSQRINKATVTVFDPSDQKEKVESLDYISAYPADLALIDIDKGAVKIIARGFRPSSYWISPDGQNIAFSHLRGQEASNIPQFVHDLVVVSLTSDPHPRIVASNVRQSFGLNVSWSPDGKQLSYITSGSRADGECFLIPVNGGAPRLATKVAHPNFRSDFRPPLWDSAGHFLYLLTTQGALWKISVAEGQGSEVARISDRNVLDIVWITSKGSFWSADGGQSLVLTTRDNETKQVGFYRVDLNTRSVTRLIEESKNYGSPTNYATDVSADGLSIAYIAEDAAHNPDVWVSDASFRTSRQVTKTNPQLDKYQLGTSRLVEWRSVDGQKLKGTVLLPANYKQGEKYPMIVYPYPIDRRSNNVNRFGITGAGVENMQLFATRGYAIFFPDIALNEGTTMRDLAKSILPGVDKVVEMGIADNDRLGVIGHSWGGYTVLSLIVQTTRFKAAIMRGGLGNLISMYGAMEKNGSARAQMLYDAGAGVHGMGGTPWEVRDRYIENSPVFYLDKVETPLLIIHGGSEGTVPIHLADEIFVDLRRLGKKVVYARYDGENHGESGWGYANQVDYINRIIEWFDNHLKVTAE